MQNSLPSGSAKTTQLCSPWPMSTRVAPIASARATSACWSSGRRSRCSRFLIVLESGTVKNQSWAPPYSGRSLGASTATPASDSATMFQPRNSAHHRARGPGSGVSTFSASIRSVMTRAAQDPLPSASSCRGGAGQSASAEVLVAHPAWGDR